MIEIPALDQPLYAQHELQKIQLQFHQNTVESASDKIVESDQKQSDVPKNPSALCGYILDEQLDHLMMAKAHHDSKWKTPDLKDNSKEYKQEYQKNNQQELLIEDDPKLKSLLIIQDEENEQTNHKTIDQINYQKINHMREKNQRGSDRDQSRTGPDIPIPTGGSSITYPRLEPPFGTNGIRPVIEELDEESDPVSPPLEAIVERAVPFHRSETSDSEIPLDFYSRNAFMITSGTSIVREAAEHHIFEQSSQDLRLDIDKLRVSDALPDMAVSILDEVDPSDAIISKMSLKLLQLPDLGVPLIDHVAQMNEAAYIDEYSAEPTPKQGMDTDATKASVVYGVNRLEPSPQLPSPLSARPLRLSLPQGIEFVRMRKTIATEMKNPAEYSLHVLFTQFVRQAERKLNRFIDYPLDAEPPILELLAEGVDPQFDNMIASLGYIAKRKPKPVMDSVMYWRKSKSEVATMAYTEVERIMDLARSVSTPSGGQFDLPVQSQSSVRSRRSLSFRRKSPFKHKRSASGRLLANEKNDKLDRGDRSEKSVKAPPASTEKQNNRIPGEVGDAKQYYDDEAKRARATAIQAERKSLASIYILCRVLIEVVRQVSAAAMGADLSSKLEEIVYNQLKTTDPVATSESFVRLANWNLFVELLGHMSEKRFLNVSDRFIADLEKVPAAVPYEDEPKLHLLVHGMRCLKLTNYPLEKFEESAEFVQSLTKFFCQSKSHTISYAYADVLSSLLLPLAPKLTAEANHPLWVDAVSQIYIRAAQMWQTLIHSSSGGAGDSDWTTLLTLMTAAIAVSSKELFSQYCFPLIEANAEKLRPKDNSAAKTRVVMCTARLLWVYVNRLPDTLNNTVKRLDRVFELFFFGAPKKQLWLVLDGSLIATVCELVRVVAYLHYNYVLENVLLRLLRALVGTGTVETMAPEKLIVVVNSYMLCLQDRRVGSRPEFPGDGPDALLPDSSKLQRTLTSATTSSKAYSHALSEYTADVEFLKMNRAMADLRTLDNIAAHEEICRSFATVLWLLDSNCGVTSWTGSEPPAARTVSALLSLLAFQFGLDFLHGTKNGSIDLFVALLDASAWSLAPMLEKGIKTELTFQALVEILVRNCNHEDAHVAAAALRSLAKLAAQHNAGNVMTLFARIAFRISEKPGTTYDADYFALSGFIRLLRIYVDLLRCWLHQFSQVQQVEEKTVDAELGNLYQINYKVPDLTSLDGVHLKPYEELEWKNIVTVIEAVEGNGLFFLCSGDKHVRQCGVSILRIVEQFDQCIYESTDGMKRASGTGSIDDDSEGHGKSETGTAIGKPSNAVKGHSRTSSKYVADEGTRVVQVIDNVDLLELLKPMKKEISVPEKARLSRIKSKKSLLFKFASSDNSIDTTIWHRIYPALLDILFEKCPIAVALCRSIVCVRLVQMHELIVACSETTKPSPLFVRQASAGPPELIITQWKLYLIFACCLLTSTNDQVLLLPPQPGHGRKKSWPMYIQYQKITSAKSVFRMVFPLLRAALPPIREAVVAGLSCANINICRTLTENLPGVVLDWNVEVRDSRDIQVTGDSTDDTVRTEVVHILSNITYRLRENLKLYADDVTLANLVSIIKKTKTFLSAPDVQVKPQYQHLRCHFATLLEHVYVGLNGTPDIGRWLPFEARIGCFTFLQDWCGYGDLSAVGDERFALLCKNAQRSNAPAAMLASLDYGRKTGQMAALSCMAALCLGTLTQPLQPPLGVPLCPKISAAAPLMTSGTIGSGVPQLLFDVKLVMRWVHALIASGNVRVEEVGASALTNILSANASNPEVCEDAVRQCYAPENTIPVREVYVTRLVDAVRQGLGGPAPYDLFCVCLFLVGSDSAEIRLAAGSCLGDLELNLWLAGLPNLTKHTFFSMSGPLTFLSTLVIYKQAQIETVDQLAASHPASAAVIVSYLCKYAHVVDKRTRGDVLACLLPWVRKVELHHDSEACARMVLDNMFELSVRYGQDHPQAIRELWEAVCASQFDVFEYIVGQCVRRRSAVLVAHARPIVTYLALLQPALLSHIVDTLVANLLPKAMVPQLEPTVGDATVGAPAATTVGTTKISTVVGRGMGISTGPGDTVMSAGAEVFPYSADLNNVVDDAISAPFSLGQLSMVFLVDLLRNQLTLATENLPLLLHISFLLLDHYLPFIQEQAVALLIHLVQVVVPPSHKSQQFIQTLRSKNPPLWIYDDLGGEKNGGITPKNMDTAVRTVLEIFTPVFPTLQHEWSHISLKWATSCAVRHVACRLFQLFRSLLSFLDQSMLKDMLHRLSNTIADSLADIQGFAMQILMTLNAITAELSSENLIDFPQLFWASVACLSTVHEHEFIETISTMSKFVSKIDLDLPDTISCLLATFPPKWDGKFVGLQEIVMVGLRSSTSWAPTMRFLDRLTRLKGSDVIGSGEPRLFCALIANLPRFLHALDKPVIPPDVEEMSLLLSEMAAISDKTGLLRILHSLAKNKFRLKKDFLIQVVAAIRTCFFPEYEAHALVLLLNFLSNKMAWVKLETLSVLKLIFPIINLQREEFVGMGADLVAPLLRLLLTEYAEQALEVIDEAVVISGLQLDKDILRMSMGNLSMRKEYEQTATLFGIPDASGWAVPMPAIAALRTRHNVHAVFSTCPNSSTLVDEKMAEQVDSEQIQFLTEDYRVLPDDADAVSMTVEAPGASLSNMWAALDDFDSFFTKPSEQRASLTATSKGLHLHSVSVDTKTSHSSDMVSPIDGADSVPQVYDKKALVILDQILARTKSNASFKSGLGESVGLPMTAGRNETPVTKRSYIPFRYSRLPKVKDPATPSTGISCVFEQTSPATPSRGSAASTPNLAHKNSSPQETLTSPTESTRFDLLNGRKRNRR